MAKVEEEGGALQEVSVFMEVRPVAYIMASVFHPCRGGTHFEAKQVRSGQSGARYVGILCQ